MTYYYGKIEKSSFIRYDKLIRYVRFKYAQAIIKCSFDGFFILY